jgi:hypothetical protein
LFSRIFKISKPASSAAYWEGRYKTGGNSGAGSYNELAEFKAEILNKAFVEYGIKQVTEFGCGDGHQLSKLEINSYIGLDVSETAIKKCTELFHSDPHKSFFLYQSAAFTDHHHLFQSDAAISLDVLFHLVEYPVFEKYLMDLFSSARRLVIIYGADLDYLPGTPHEYYRKFTGYISLNFPEWQLEKLVKNIYPSKSPEDREGSLCDFYFYTRK